MSIPQRPSERRGRDNYPAMIQSPSGFRASFVAGDKRPFPTDLGGSASDPTRTFRRGIPKLARRDGSYPGEANVPRFGDQGSDAGYMRMNARVFYEPRFNGRDVEFNYGDYLVIVRNRANYTSADSHNPEAEDYGGRTAATPFRIATMALLAEEWSRAHEWRESVMKRTLEEPVRPEEADYAGGRYQVETMELDEARSDDPNWATTIEEFDHNYIPLGPFVSHDIPGQGPAGSGYFAKLNADPLLACTIEGNYDIHPNIFGVTKSSGAFVGYVVKKLQAASSGRRTGSLLEEARAPLQFIPYSSEYIPRPFIASDGTEYAAFLEDQRLWVAERDTRAENESRRGVGILRSMRTDEKLREGHVRVALTINQARIGLRPMRFMQSHEAIISHNNGNSSGDRCDRFYCDLAYEDVEMYRDDRTRQIRLMPVWETGRYIRLGFMESLEKGSGEVQLQSDMTKILNNTANKPQIKSIGNETTFRVRVGVM